MLNKLEEFKQMLLDKDCPLAIDEILGQVQYLFEDDKEIFKILDTYIDNYMKMFYCAQKFYKVKELVDEQFYAEVENDR